MTKTKKKKNGGNQKIKNGGNQKKMAEISFFLNFPNQTENSLLFAFFFFFFFSFSFLFFFFKKKSSHSLFFLKCSFGR